MSKNNKNGKNKAFPFSAIIAGILVVALVIGLGVYAIQSRNTSSAQKETPEAETSMKPHMEGAKDFVEETAKDAENDEDDEENVSEDSAVEVDENGVEAGYEAGIPYDGDIVPPDLPPDPTPRIIEYVTPAPLPTISFPYAIPGTDLVVQQISPYSGYYLEDGSDKDVSNIAAIVLTNNGEALDFVGIGISQGMTSFAFSGSQILANSTVIIQEQTGAAFVPGEYNTCTATVTPSAGMQTSSDLVQITDNGNNTFMVANISDKTISEVTVYFKNYLPDEDVYVGGITYHVTLEDIEPETGVEVNSGHYASGYSVIVDMDITE